ncbi:hypothetical protein K340107D12_49050 [Blautia parvula]|uniref:Uncharacterized protein n=1 Tax=Blautia parvula TaxID=2877527 RepID=A0ABQ0BZY6_9FIRM
MYDGNIEKTIHKTQDGPLLLPPLPFPYTASPLLFRVERPVSGGKW